MICGLGGEDVLYARDGARDVVIGGPGVDTAYVDQFDQVESVEHPPSAGALNGLVRNGRLKVLPASSPLRS